ncbi:hypothetical protein D3C78_948990 [compost metagenome]
MSIEVSILIACALRTNAEATPAIAVAVAHLVADIAALLGVPVISRDTTGEKIASAISQRLVNVDLETITLTIGYVAITALGTKFSEIGQIEITLAGEAICGKHEVGLRSLHQLAVSEPVTLSAHAAAQAITLLAIAGNIHV